MLVSKRINESIFQRKLGAGIQWMVRQWIDYSLFDNQCINLLFIEKTIVICLKKVKKYHNRLIIFLLIINVLIYYSLKKTIVICLKKCQKVSPILCLSLSEFIFQHKLSSCQVEMKIPEVML